MTLHPLAFPLVSTRPLVTKRACTPPSRAPFEENLKRASRAGPFIDRNDGILLRAPKAVPTVTCGLSGGDDPPAAGWLWQPTQLSRLKRGPRPSPIPSTSANVFWPSRNNVLWSGLRFASGSPAAGLPPRTPGSVAAPAACAANTNRKADVAAVIFDFMTSPFPKSWDSTPVRSNSQLTAQVVPEMHVRTVPLEQATESLRVSHCAKGARIPTQHRKMSCAADERTPSECQLVDFCNQAAVARYRRAAAARPRLYRFETH